MARLSWQGGNDYGYHGLDLYKIDGIIEMTEDFSWRFFRLGIVSAKERGRHILIFCFLLK